MYKLALSALRLTQAERKSSFLPTSRFSTSPLKPQFRFLPPGLSIETRFTAKSNLRYNPSFGASGR